MPEPIGLYEDAAIYDILHTPDTAEEVDGLERTAARFVRRSRRRPVWIEPACGTGRYLRVAIRRGIDVIGFDASPGMIEYARRRLGGALGRKGGSTRKPGGRARLFVADMTTFAARLGRARADFAFNPINSIRHLPSDRAVLDHFAQVARVLRPGGAYAVGITLTTYGMEFPSEDLWEGRRGNCRVRQVIQYIPPIGTAAERRREEVAHSHLIVTRGREGGRVDHRDSRYVLRTYSRRQWHALIARSALRLLAVVDDAGRDTAETPSGYAVYVLGRRAGSGTPDRAVHPAPAASLSFRPR